MVDFLYVRKKYRNKGLGKMILLTILTENAGADLYFSVPLSFSLCKSDYLIFTNCEIQDIIKYVECLKLFE